VLRAGTGSNAFASIATADNTVGNSSVRAGDSMILSADTLGIGHYADPFFSCNTVAAAICQGSPFSGGGTLTLEAANLSLHGGGGSHTQALIAGAGGVDIDITGSGANGYVEVIGGSGNFAETAIRTSNG